MNKNVYSLLWMGKYRHQTLCKFPDGCAEVIYLIANSCSSVSSSISSSGGSFISHESVLSRITLLHFHPTHWIIAETAAFSLTNPFVLNLSAMMPLPSPIHQEPQTRADALSLDPNQFVLFQSHHHSFGRRRSAGLVCNFANINGTVEIKDVYISNTTFISRRGQEE